MSPTWSNSICYPTHQTSELAYNELFLNILPLNDTGRFPIKACSGNQYVMIAYHAGGNLILQQPFKTKSDAHRLAAYNTITTHLAAKGLSVDLQIMDNKASDAFKQAITFAWHAKFQLVPPDIHPRNRAKQAIRSELSRFIFLLSLLALIRHSHHICGICSLTRTTNPSGKLKVFYSTVLL